MPQEPTEIVVYSHGEDNGDDDEIPEMDNNVELIFEAWLLTAPNINAKQESMMTITILLRWM